MRARDRPALRFDVTTGDWVLFAPARASRPHAQPRHAVPPEITGPCPFCPGNEHLSPAEILREDDGRGGWSVRVVRNAFPALDPTVPAKRRALGPLWCEMQGHGAHEVVVESPEHSRPLAEQPLEQIERVLRVLHARLESLMGDRTLRAAIIFKNQGERAGTSLTHPHWQIIATPVVPRLLRLAHRAATDYFDRTGTCLHRVLLEEELANRTRVLCTNEAFAAVLPFASRVPYQIRILPRTPVASFVRVPPSDFAPLASLLGRVLQRLSRAIGNPDFNLTVNTAPFGTEDDPRFVWHIDVLPRLTTPAGFELGSGIAINPVLPEDAAAVLRARPHEEASQ